MISPHWASSDFFDEALRRSWSSEYNPATVTGSPIRIGDMKVGGLYKVTTDALGLSNGISLEDRHKPHMSYGHITPGNVFIFLDTEDVWEGDFTRHWFHILSASFGKGVFSKLGNDKFTNITRLLVLWEPQII